jgi:cytochrome P450
MADAVTQELGAADEEALYRRVYHVPQDGLASADLYPKLHALREEAAVHEGQFCELVGRPYRDIRFEPGRPYFSCYSWEACEIAFKDNETFSSEFYHLQDTWGRMIGGMVGEEHRRYRAAIAPPFTKRQAGGWWGPKWIAPIVDDLMTDIERRGSSDLSIELFAKLPVRVIMASFGVPDVDAIRYRSIIEGILDIDSSAETRRDAREQIGVLLTPVIRARRERPVDDLLNALATEELVEADGTRHRLNDEEVISHAIQILVAGSSTTWRQSGVTLLALLRHPDQWQNLLTDRGLLRGAVEEALRWESVAPSFPRLVTRDTTLCGIKLPAGAVLDVVNAAANRDPARWSDPDRFDINRPMHSNMAFGAGPHLCLGLHVARAEIAAVLTAVMDRLPGLRLDPSQPEPFVAGKTGGLHHRAPTALPVTFQSKE